MTRVEGRCAMAHRNDHGRWSDCASVRQAALDRSDARRRYELPGGHALSDAVADRQASAVLVLTYQ